MMPCTCLDLMPLVQPSLLVPPLAVVPLVLRMLAVQLVLLRMGQPEELQLVLPLLQLEPLLYGLLLPRCSPRYHLQGPFDG